MKFFIWDSWLVYFKIPLFLSWIYISCESLNGDKAFSFFLVDCRDHGFLTDSERRSDNTSEGFIDFMSSYLLTGTSLFPTTSSIDLSVPATFMTSFSGETKLVKFLIWFHWWLTSKSRSLTLSYILFSAVFTRTEFLLPYTLYYSLIFMTLFCNFFFDNFSLFFLASFFCS